MSTQDEKIDAFLMAAASAEWTKTALLISKVFDDPAFDKGALSGGDVADRLYILIDNGALEGRGNMRRWRDSDVRLVGK